MEKDLSLEAMAPLDTTASTMTAEQFATHTKSEVKDWGTGGKYKCVVVGRTEYIWTAAGVYDGWGVHLPENVSQ